MGAGAAAVVGPMPPCVLGKDKIKQQMKWSDWHKDATNKVRVMGMNQDDQKLNFLRSCAGHELTEFWEKEARVRSEAKGEREARTYQQVVKETSKCLLKLISRDRAIINLLRMEQGTRSFMEFLSEVEEQEHLTRQGGDITGEDLKRMGIMGGLKDRALAEKALAEEYRFQHIVQAAVSRPAGRRPMHSGRGPRTRSAGWRRRGSRSTEGAPSRPGLTSCSWSWRTI